MNNSIPFIMSDSGYDLGCVDDVPSVPLRRNDSKLTEALKALGIDLRSATGAQRSELSSTKEVGVVVSVGLTWRIGRLYSHLTRRRHLHFRNLSMCKEDLPADSIVVGLLSDLALEDYERLSLAAHRVGILSAATLEDLRIRSLLCYAAYRVIPAADHACVVLPDQQGDGRSGGLRVLGASPPGTLAAALVHQTVATVIATHGDGLDARLGPAQALCPLPSTFMWDGERKRGVPHCLTSRRCFRLGINTDGVAETSRIFPTGALRTNLLVLATCFGITAADSLLSTEYSLLGSILANMKVVSILSCSGVIFPQMADIVMLTRSIECLKSVADALAHFTSSDSYRSGRLRFCHFGEPRFNPRRLPVTIPELRYPPPPDGLPPSGSSYNTSWDLLADRVLPQRTPEIFAQIVREAYDKVGDIERLYWGVTQPPRTIVDNVRCPCGVACRTFCFDIRPNLKRLHDYCLRCGLVRTVPLRSNFRNVQLEVIDDRFVIGNGGGARLLCAFIRAPDLTTYWLEELELPPVSSLCAGETAVLAFLQDTDDELLIVRRRVVV